MDIQGEALGIEFVGRSREQCGGAGLGSWRLLTFAVPGSPTDYVAASGAIRVQIVASNSNDAADFDYAVVVLNTSSAAHTHTDQRADDAHANGGILLRALWSPDTVDVHQHGAETDRYADHNAVHRPARSHTSRPDAHRPRRPARPGLLPAFWHPPARVSWNWVLSRVPQPPYRNVQMYDVDGFDATAADVASIHNPGMKVVCYLSVGTYENWRADAGQFPAAILGDSLDGWPGERWLDVRDIRQPGGPGPDHERSARYVPHQGFRRCRVG